MAISSGWDTDLIFFNFRILSRLTFPKSTITHWILFGQKILVHWALFRVCVYTTLLQKALIPIDKFCLFNWVNFVLVGMENAIESAKLKRNVSTKPAHQRYVPNSNSNECACVDVFPRFVSRKALNYILLFVGKSKFP